MDVVKDIANRDSLTKFFDSTLIRTDAFGHNVSAERAYRRAERIAAAIHLVTNHVPSEEPVRTAARATAIELLVGTLALRETLRSPASRELTIVQGLVRRAISFVRILSVTGRISIQNAEALIAALDELGSSLPISQRSHLAETISLTKDDFAVVSDTLSATPTGNGVLRRSARSRGNAIGRYTAASDNVSPAPARTEEIVGLLGAQGQIGIKDIAASLPSYSEKMIQRELKRLVELGRVRKVGEKRWSMYELAKH